MTVINTITLTEDLWIRCINAGSGRYIIIDHVYIEADEDREGTKFFEVGGSGYDLKEPSKLTKLYIGDVIEIQEVK